MDHANTLGPSASSSRRDQQAKTMAGIIISTHQNLRQAAGGRRPAAA
ncbi:hypothetical protein X743_27285 [Mesorhizobium sp. LNHC252B00]|nr:hypothetical protein X743_27285 [Mesorhizobium sp. LNHC252B00]